MKMEMEMAISRRRPPPPLLHVMECQWYEIIDGRTEVLGEKPVPVPLCPPQIPHGLTQDQTRAPVVGGQQLPARAMAHASWTLTDSQRKTLNQETWIVDFSVYQI
jgi:hypothetical protein